MQLYRRLDQSVWRTSFQWIGARVRPTALVAAGVGILAWSAFSSPLPNPSQTARLNLLAAVFNVWGGAEFARIGRADSKHARSAVRRLFSVGASLGTANDTLREAVADGEPERVLSESRVMISQVESVQRHLFDAIGDWDDVHTEALSDVLRGQQMASDTRLRSQGHDSG